MATQDRVNSNPGGAATDIAGGSSFGGDLMAEIQKSLLSSSGIVSSDTSGLDKVIEDAISTSKKSTEATKARIEGTADREIGIASMEESSRLNTFQEERRGFATLTAGLSNMLQTSDKRIKDLDQRKQELLLAADAEGAKAVTDLMVKEYELQQSAQEKSFNRLLSLGSFGLQQSQEQRLSSAQNFQESQAISSIALKYGLNVSDGETLQSITAKALPFASEEQKLELAKASAEVTKLNAEAKKAMAGGSLDDITIDAIAMAYRKNPAVLSQETNTERIAAVINKASDIEKDEVERALLTAKTSGMSKAEALKNISDDPAISDKVGAMNLANEIYAGSITAPSKRSLLDRITGFIDEPTAKGKEQRNSQNDAEKESLKNQFTYWKGISEQRDLSPIEKNRVSNIRRGAEQRGLKL
jgi:hypothetical protein